MTVEHTSRLPPGRRTGTVARAAVVLLAYAAVAAMARPNTVPATVALIVPIVVVVAVAVRQPSRLVEQDQRQRRTTMLWIVVASLGLAWEAGAYVGEHVVGPHDYPTVSALVEPALQQPPIRFAAWAVWLLAGWRLVRR